MNDNSDVYMSTSSGAGKKRTSNGGDASQVKED